MFHSGAITLEEGGPTLPTLYKEKEAFVNPSEVETKLWTKVHLSQSMDLLSAKCGTTLPFLLFELTLKMDIYCLFMVKHMACKGAHSFVVFLWHISQKGYLLNPMWNTRRIIQRFEIISKKKFKKILQIFTKHLASPLLFCNSYFLNPKEKKWALSLVTHNLVVFYKVTFQWHTWLI